MVALIYAKLRFWLWDQWASIPDPFWRGFLRGWVCGGVATAPLQVMLIWHGLFH